MIIILKKFTALMLLFILTITALPVMAVDYDEIGAYEECCLLYPDFVQRVKDCGATDSQIISFLGSVEDNLLTYDDVLTEENFDTYMFNAIKTAFDLRKNRFVRDALLKAYPDSIDDARKGIVTEEFMPIYITVKMYLFGIKSPVITISHHTDGEKLTLFPHSVRLPEDCMFVMAVYGEDGSVLHTKYFTPNKEGESFECDLSGIKSAEIFAWEKGSIAPLCDSYKLVIN